MSLGKKLFIGGDAACTTDTADKFGDSSGVALYSLDYDASDAGGNYDGAPTDVTFGVDGQINYGASFNGSSSKIEFTTDSNFVNDITISAWINMSQLPASPYLYQVVAWGDEAAGERRSLGIWNGGSGDPKVYFSGYGGSANFGGSTSVSANQWYHVCVTRSGSTVKVYLNGSLDGTGTVTLNAYTGTTGRIGDSGSANENFNGKIDQVRIFNKAISATEVSTLYGETACVYTSTTDIVNYQGTNAAYYKLDNNAEDETGNYDGTETNINYEFGRFGQAAVFNGSSSYITANKSMFGTGDGTADVFTISLWFNTTTNNGVLAGTRGNSATQGFILWLLSDGTIRYDEANATGSVDTLITTNTYDDGNWHNVVVTRNASNQATLYVDGSVQVSTTTITTALTSHTNNLFIGMYSASSLHYNGSMDQVRIFNSALDATAVANLYNEKPEANTSNFETVIYEGNGGSQYISNVGFQPDLIWAKSRAAGSHIITDSLRGDGKEIYSDLTNAEGTVNRYSIESNGFSVSTSGYGNANGVNYVAWVWKGGGDAVLNQNGNINSQVSANQDAGFSIVKSTYTSTDNYTVGHGLNQRPEIVFNKNLDQSDASYGPWWTWIEGVTGTNGDYIRLNGTAGKSAFSDTFTTDTTIKYHTGFQVTGTNKSIVSYCFHSVTGYQKVGSYSGSGSSNKVVTTGFRPRFLMIKNASTGSTSWAILDTKRDDDTSNNNGLFANLNIAEWGANTNTINVDFTDTGFTIQNAYVLVNALNDTYIYLAIA